MRTTQATRKFYQQKRFVLTVFLFVISLIGINTVNSALTYAAPVTGFNPGKIIDDTVFTNANSMNAAQIQAFLNSKMPNCETWHAAGYGQNPPFICLRDYTENGRSAAQIIYDTAQQYQINPQVLIVLLQKEQSLVTDTWPLNTQYRTATGYACPDNAPCDSQYYGLTSQLKWSGTMFRAIMNNSPTWYTPYVLGNNTIYYNPGPYDNANNRYFGRFGDRRDIQYCGSTVVNIQNRSTQALYNYTPYQPNQASLNAGYGSAGSCGAYGNRNFFLYFTDWFGPTTRNLVTTPGNGVYQVENGVKRAFPNEITFLSYGYAWSEVLSIGDAEFNQLPFGSVMPYNTQYRNGQLVTTDGNSIYLVADGKRRNVPNESVFLSQSWQWSYVRTISSVEFSQIPEGTAVPYNPNYRNGQLVTTDGNSIYLVADGKRRNVPNESVFLSYSWKWSYVRTISTIEFGQIPLGDPVPRNSNG